MIVIDPSAAVLALLGAGAARERVAVEELHVPHLADTEVASGLRRQVLRGRITAQQGGLALAEWTAVSVLRHPAVGLLPRIWELRENVIPADASYVALAEWLDCPLLTSDVRLVAAPGPRCAFLTVRS